MIKSLILLGAVSGLALNAVAATSTQTTSGKISEVKKEAEPSPISYVGVLEVSREAGAFEGGNRANTTTFGQELKATKALDADRSVRVSVRSHTDFNAWDETTSKYNTSTNIFWAYGQYADSKFANINGKDLSLAVRLYVPTTGYAGGLNGDRSGNGLLTQLRPYQSMSWNIGDRMTLGFTVQERIYIGDGLYNDIDGNRALLIRATGDFTYQINNMFSYGLYMGPNYSWTNAGRQSESNYIWTEINAKISDKLTLTAAAEAANNLDDAGIDFLNNDDTLYYLYGTVKF